MWLAHEFRSESGGSVRGKVARRHPQWATEAPISGRSQSEGLHTARTQHLLRGRACSRQTKLLAHGCPSAIWGSAQQRRPLASLQPSVFQKSTCGGPEPCKHPPVTGRASPRHGPLQHQTSASIARQGHTANGAPALTEIAAIRT